MKRWFYILIKPFYIALKWMIPAMLIPMVIALMTLQVMPILASEFVGAMGFTEDATVMAILFLGGFPMLFLTLCMFYCTMKGLDFLCRKNMTFFNDLAVAADEKLAALENEPAKPKSEKKRPWKKVKK